MTSKSNNEGWRNLASWGIGGNFGPWRLQNIPFEERSRLRILEDGQVKLALPGSAFSGMRVKICGAEGSGRIGIHFDDYYVQVGGPDSIISQCSRIPRVLGATAVCARSCNESFQLECFRGNGQLALDISGSSVLSCADPLPEESVAVLSLDLPQGLSFEEISVEVLGQHEIFLAGASGITNRERRVHVCIDFYDDLLHGAWNTRSLDEAMQYYTSKGIGRVYFVYHYGFHGGFWDQPGKEKAFQENIFRTFESIGDFLPAAVQSAHRHGLELYAVIKPFEAGMFFTFPDGTAEAQKYGKVRGLGGWHWWCPDFTAQHPHLRMERRLLPPLKPVGGIRKIVLEAEEWMAMDFEPRSLRLWVSPNNGRYVPYTGTMHVRKDHDNPRRVILEGLDIQEPFLALEAADPERAVFGNILRNLIRVFDAAGNLLPITFSTRPNPPGGNFEEFGFAMDVPGVGDSASSLDSFFLFQNSSVLGIGIGVESHLQGALCPAYPGVRGWWMQQVENCVQSGVDGIDFRIKNHNRTYDWDAFGFNSPLVKAFKQRFHVDIRREDFVRENWRRLRGEYYTEFLKSARERLSQAGKQMHLHVESDMNAPQWHTAMEIHFDWQRWIQEGLADEITIKMMKSMRAVMAGKVAESAHRAGDLPLNFNPSLHGIQDSPKHRAYLARLVDDAREGGCGGFIMYENALFMAVKPGGAIEITKPWLVNAIVERFSNG